MHRASKKKTATAQSKNQDKTGQIRIIAGLWRGRKLKVLNHEGLRPTTDRVKETLFNWLMHQCHEARCLDLFSGSGSLGFEALSRQAGHVSFIEKEQTAARLLEQNAQLLKLSKQQAQVINQDALRLLDTPPAEAYDIVFVDPPFHKELLEEACNKLEAKQWLKPEALIYLECEATLQQLQLPDHWQLLKQKKFGQVLSSLYQRKA